MMFFDHSSYAAIPNLGLTCKCRNKTRVYVAMSEALNRRAVSGTASDRELRPYVFKVGSTRNTCRDRWSSMTEDRKPATVDGEVIYAEPRYAGVDDWKVLACWVVSREKYDDCDFKPWLEKSRFREDARAIGRYTTAEAPGVARNKGFVDLVVMSEAYARSLCATRHNDPLNDVLLATVARAVVLLAREFALSDGGFG